MTAVWIVLGLAYLGIGLRRLVRQYLNGEGWYVDRERLRLRLLADHRPRFGMPAYDWANYKMLHRHDYPSALEWAIANDVEIPMAFTWRWLAVPLWPLDLIRVRWVGSEPGRELRARERFLAERQEAKDRAEIEKTLKSL